jgi:predicted TIM-barrel fold metal-dependent hydrolase
LSSFNLEPALREVANWKVMDANVHLGHSGVHGHLALEKPALLKEMDRFAIEEALVSHFVGEEYDISEGNAALVRDMDPRFVPAWSASAEDSILDRIDRYKPRAVRLWFSALRHNFSSSPWSAGVLYDYLQERAILMTVSREELDWNSLASILQDFPKLRVLLLNVGYRSDRYLLPLLKRFPHLHFDSTTFVAHRQFESFVQTYGPERILFGSRLPLYTPGAALAVLATARISEDARLRIAGGNLRRLLGEAS